VAVRFEVELIAGHVSKRHGVAGLRPHATGRIDVVIGNRRQITHPIVPVNQFADVLVAAIFPRFASRSLQRVVFISGHSSVAVGQLSSVPGRVERLRPRIGPLGFAERPSQSIVAKRRDVVLCIGHRCDTAIDVVSGLDSKARRIDRRRGTQHGETIRF